MANLVKLEPLFFTLISGSRRAEIILLVQNLPIGSTSILGNFHTNFLGTLPFCFFDLVEEPGECLGTVKLHQNLLDLIGSSTAPTRCSGAGAPVKQMFDRMSRILR
jgi:hypothetical protein